VIHPKFVFILSCHPRLSLHGGLYCPGSPIETLHAFICCFTRATCPLQLIFDLQLYLTESISYEAPRCSVVSNLQSLHLPSVHMLPEHLAVEISSVNFLPCMPETKFNTHIRLLALL
jgi:hypothetical protein